MRLELNNPLYFVKAARIVGVSGDLHCIHIDTHNSFSERPEFFGTVKQCKTYFGRNYYPKSKWTENEK